MYLPTLDEIRQSRLNTEVFRGRNHNLRIGSGEWYETRNTCASYYPLFSNRRARGIVAQCNEPHAMLAKDALMYIDGSAVIYNGYPIPGINLSTAEDMLPKQMVSMGAYAVIFPDKVYINTTDLSDCGSIEARFVAASNDTVTLQMCRADGSAYEVAHTGDTEPETPANGDYWIDTSGSIHVLKQYSESAGMWMDVATTYVRIGCQGIDNDFRLGDGVTIGGLSGTDQVAALNVDNIIEDLGEDYIVVTGILDAIHTQSGGLTAARLCPDMDYVTESNNRIWGCKYGYVNGQTINEIYACKLGDFRNWRCYAGLSTDSYAVSVGTDGRFTGAITHLGYPLFFKENCIHKIYGSMPSQYAMNTTMCRGVQLGSWKSLAIVNEVLYYHSREGVVAYDGSLPVSVSEHLGTERYSSAAAGSLGAVYYISMQDIEGIWHMFTYDTEKRIWHREDNTHALCFANVRGDLMYMDADTKKLISASGMSGDPEGPIEWSATSGVMGYEYPDSKYLSRYNLRVKLGAGAELTMYIEYDSDGEWHDMGTYTGTELLRTITIPVIPRRCDHLRLKLSGIGDVKLYSITRYLEGGSDHWL